MPDALRRYTGGEGTVAVTGETVGEAMAAAFRLHPDLRLRLVDESGRVYRHLVVFRNDTELPRESLEATVLAPADTVTFLEAVGGGAG